MKGNFILGHGFIYVLLNAFTLVKLKVRQKLIRYSKLSVMYCNLELGFSRELPSYNDTSILLDAIPYEKKSIGEYWIQYFFRSKVLEIREKSTGSNTYQYFFFIRDSFSPSAIHSALPDKVERSGQLGTNNITRHIKGYNQLFITYKITAA